MSEQSQPRRINGDVMLQLVKELGDVYGQGSLLRQHFEKVVIPQMQLGKAWHEELTDAEYEDKIGKLRSEIPQILTWLEHKFPGPPPPNRY